MMNSKFMTFPLPPLFAGCGLGRQLLTLPAKPLTKLVNNRSKHFGVIRHQFVKRLAIKKSGRFENRQRRAVRCRNGCHQLVAGGLLTKRYALTVSLCTFTWWPVMISIIFRSHTSQTPSRRSRSLPPPRREWQAPIPESLRTS